MTGNPKQKRELFMARRELANAERLLRRAASTLDTVVTLLDKAAEQEADDDAGD